VLSNIQSSHIIKVKLSEKKY